MPNLPPPSNAVFARAAELRVGGATWETVAKEVRRAESTSALPKSGTASLITLSLINQ